MQLQNFEARQKHLLIHQLFELLLPNNHRINTIFDFQKILYIRSSDQNKPILCG